MRHWLYLTNRSNWEVTKNKNILGASERYRNVLSRVEQQDHFLVYVKQEKGSGPYIIGAYRANSTLFYDPEVIFADAHSKHERYPLRIHLKELAAFGQPIDFKHLIPKLSFIKNKQYWSLQLKGRALIEIPATDYNLIVSSRYV